MIVDIDATDKGTILQYSGSGWYIGSGFDATTVGDPTVVKVGGAYTLLYSGMPFWNNIQIGLATSSDGVTWTKSSANPVISNAQSPSWASFREMPATLMYENGTYELWFNGDNSNLATDSGYGTGFGLATSTDGINWTIGSNPIRWELNTPNGTGIGLEEVVKLGGQYFAYYANVTPAGTAQDYAVSADGKNFSGDAPVGLPSGYRDGFQMAAGWMCAGLLGPGRRLKAPEEGNRGQRRGAMEISARGQPQPRAVSA